MIIDRLYTPGLAQVAYIVADADAGVAAVIDPRRDVDVYLDWAEAHRVRIVAILETHIHADFVSGARDLSALTGAPIYVSRIGQQAFAHEPLDDGTVVEIGSLRLRALATPGHTPEHLAYLLFDPAAASGPVALCSGDALFVGDVGRPDLLGAEETQRLATQLYHTVARLRTLDDALPVYPGHTAGSACGKKIGDAPSTTIGREKVGNYAFAARSEADFVRQVLAEMPPPPTYYPVLKRVNKDGAPLLDTLPSGVPLQPAEVAARHAAGDIVIDTRPPGAFGAGHILGARFAGLGPNFTAWMGWMASYDCDLILVIADDALFADAQNELRRIGLDRVAGFLAGGMGAWRAAGEPVTTLPPLSVRDLAARLANGAEDLFVLDVRSDDEWRTGHIAGAHHHFAGRITQGDLPTLPTETPVAVLCGSGYRSSVAGSLLQASRHNNLINVTGGMSAWEEAGLPTRQG